MFLKSNLEMDQFSHNARNTQGEKNELSFWGLLSFPQNAQKSLHRKGEWLTCKVFVVGLLHCMSIVNCRSIE